MLNFYFIKNKRIHDKHYKAIHTMFAHFEPSDKNTTRNCYLYIITLDNTLCLVNNISGNWTTVWESNGI